MAIQYLDNGNPDGTVFGQSTTAKLGFYGLATPIVQPTVTAVTTTTATTALNETRVSRIEAALVALGLINLA